MARGQVTISTHGGHAVAWGHNRRDPEIVKHEPHIDPDGVHEIWQDESLRAVYEREFEPARLEYDRKARKSRRIGKPYLDYLTEEAARLDTENEQIRAANAEAKAWNELHAAEIEAGAEKAKEFQKEKAVKRPVYEEILGVYAQDDLELTDEECRELLRLHVMGDGTPEHPSWQERHPGLRVVGIYYHADEPDGGGPHVHLDYVPVADCSRGMARQNSLEQALALEGLRSGKVMGIDGQEHLQTAREQWSAAENQHLQTICEEADLEVIHPQRGKHSVHVSTAEKKLIGQLEEEAERQERKQASLDSQQRGLELRAEALARERQELDEQRAELKRQQEQLHKDLEQLKADREAQEALTRTREDAARETQAKAQEALKTAREALQAVKQLRLDVRERQKAGEIAAALGKFEATQEHQQTGSYGKQLG